LDGGFPNIESAHSLGSFILAFIIEA